jgi:putative glutamine amidotransferase
MSRPLIGLTTRTLLLPRQISADRSQAAGEDYVASIEEAGGLPVLLPSCLGPGRMAELFDRVEGVLLTGGPDVDPELFGEEPQPGLGDVDRVRDEAEIALCRLAAERDRPLLAVCRGIQLLNVAFGGGMVQHLDPADGWIEHDVRSFDDRAGHTIRIREGTLLHRVTGRDRLRVNSAHHQGVVEAAEPLVASAVAPDGVIEALEHPDRRFLLGVEWHPERAREKQEESAALLRAFVAACGER